MDIKKDAYAKINLALDVVGKRENGYHEVRMIMHSVDLFDTLSFHRREDEKLVLTTDRKELPTDADNLICKAAALLMEEAGERFGLDISLKKRIPMAAGLAGGSTDAAATLRAVNEYLDGRFSEKELADIALRIGADVPYCLMGGTALSEGIGEILTPLPALPKVSILLAKPPIDVSTRYVYEHLKWDKVKEHPDIDGMIRALTDGDISAIADCMGNVLESVTEKKYKVIGRIKKLCIEQGAVSALMSGSGPTVFAFFYARHDAVMAAEQIKAKKWASEVFVI